MAHLEQKVYIKSIKDKFPHYFNNNKVLEVGSLNINGSIREFFDNCRYIGLDVSSGNGVDVICGGQNYNAPDNSYDVVCSAECFEHNPYWLETFQNMIRLCKNDGLVLFTCATEGRPEHGTTRTTPQDSPLTVGIGWDYYQNLTENDFIDNLDFNSYFKDYSFEVNQESHDLYFWGIVSKNSVEQIPVIGVPIVNGFHWLQRLVDSIDYPVKELCVINNNGRGELDDDLEMLSKTPHKFIENIKICHLPANIGCSGAWNLIIKSYMMEPYWLIVNNDVAFTPGLLKELVERSKNDQYGVIKGKEFQWDLFLIKDWVVQKCGLFDENLYPAYAEDCDYFLRLLNADIKSDHLEIKHLHGDSNYENSGSQTIKLDVLLKDKLEYSNEVNVGYLSTKWGPYWRGLEWEYFNPYKNPFDKLDFPISYTSYDLEFVRSKNLGF
jgi:SAM-dependent methyltransferase